MTTGSVRRISRVSEHEHQKLTGSFNDILDEPISMSSSSSVTVFFPAGVSGDLRSREPCVLADLVLETAVHLLGPAAVIC